MEDLLYAAKYINLPPSNQPKLLYFKDVKKIIDRLDDIMSIIPSLNEELCRIIYVIKQPVQLIETMYYYIQKGEKILSRMRDLNYEMRSLCHKVNGISKTELTQIKQLIYSQRTEQHPIEYHRNQLDRMNELIIEFKRLIK